MHGPLPELPCKTAVRGKEEAKEMTIQRTCPFERPTVPIKDVVRAMREHPQLSSMAENGIRIRLFRDKLLCDNYCCKHIKHDGIAMSFCSKAND